MTKVTRAGADFNPTPSIERSAALTIGVAGSIPPAAGAVGFPVATEGAVAGELGVDRAALGALGFEGKVGQTLVVPKADGPSLVAIGIGDPAELNTSKLRDAAAAFARAVGKQARLATTLPGVAGVPPVLAGQVVVEGILLARYHYDVLKHETSDVDLTDLSLIAASGQLEGVTRGGGARPDHRCRSRPRARPRQHAARAPDRSPDGRGCCGDRRGTGARGRDLRCRRLGGARLRRPAGRERRQRRAAADDQAGLSAGKSQRGAPVTSSWSARASCTTRAASASSRATPCTPR